MWTSYCLKLDLDAGKNGLGEGTVGVMAVFDGHIGEEASEMASKLLLDYFYVHALFNTSELMEQYEWLPVTEDEITHLEILKEALLRTIRDIDFKFSQASRICSLLVLLTGFLHRFIYVLLYAFRRLLKRGFSQDPQPLWLFLLMGRF